MAFLRLSKTSHSRKGEVESEIVFSVTIEFAGERARSHSRKWDLEELDLVDIEGVRFLNACESAGVSILHYSPYIREWMLRERGRPKAHPKNRRNRPYVARTTSAYKS